MALALKLSLSEMADFFLEQKSPNEQQNKKEDHGVNPIDKSDRKKGKPRTARWRPISYPYTGSEWCDVSQGIG